VIGGPPCQAFSRSNVYPKADDIRRTLPGQFARILKELNQYHPLQFFVFENVQGLTFERHREEFARFRFLFEEAGFKLFETLLNAKDFDVPQDRPRVFIVGVRQELVASLGSDFNFPHPTSSPIPVEVAFSEAFGTIPGPEPAFFRRDLAKTDIPFHPNHWTMMPKSPKFHNGMLKEGEIKGRSFRVLAWDKPSWTVAYGNREIHVHPSGKRRLSIFEAMVLQGFPKSYVLKGTLSDQVKLVSDAVPPPLARHIALALQGYLQPMQTIHEPTTG
jgi:DNA (cytosine-5)-methyltransferase 1